MKNQVGPMSMQVVLVVSDKSTVHFLYFNYLFRVECVLIVDDNHDEHALVTCKRLEAVALTRQRASPSWCRQTGWLAALIPKWCTYIDFHQQTLDPLPESTAVLHRACSDP